MTKPRLCVTVTATTTAELRRRRDAVRDADLVELRLDGVSDPDVAGALAGRRLPAIVTCRPTWEGGRVRRLRRRTPAAPRRGAGAAAPSTSTSNGARGFDDLVGQTGGRRIVLSSHDFESVPADLAERARAMRATGAEVIKIAVTAQRLSDCLPLRRARTGDAARRRHGPDRDGLEGARHARARRPFRLRLDVRRFARRGRAALARSPARRRIGSDRLGSDTAVYGLVGSPIDHSVSPAMHNAAFRGHVHRCRVPAAAGR